MKEICLNCKNAGPVDKATVDKSVELQAGIAKAKMAGNKEDRKTKIAAIKESVEYTDLLKVDGMVSLAKKPSDPKEGSVYITCSDAEHLKDEKAEVAVVHKYYFGCPHFAAKP